MISHENKCIFVHIPKCGGTSVEDALWPGPRTEADLWAGRHVEDGMNQSLHHLYANQIREKVGNEIFVSYFKFAFVRNPWDRAVSQYIYVRRHWPWLNLQKTYRFATFRNFLNTVEKVHDTKWQPQHRYLFDADGKLLMDFVGRLENFPADFKTVCDKLKLGDVTLPHKKKSVRNSAYADYYTPATREIVARIYRDDIDTFGYKF